MRSALTSFPWRPASHALRLTHTPRTSRLHPTPDCPFTTGFAIHKRGHPQDQKKHRRRQAAAACKQTWSATHRDFTLKHAATALLHRQPRPRPPQSDTIVDGSGDDDDEACCTALDQWEQRDARP